jgi:MYXO-CTERM domain-containing protein
MAVTITRGPSAIAATCTVPGDCTPVDPVCHLGVCVPCVSSYDDGGIHDPVAACQDPARPYCEIPDGSVGGECFQCRTSLDCPNGETCDQGTCVASDAGTGDGSAGDGGTQGDASVGDGGNGGDGSAGDSGTSNDGGGGTQDGGGPGDGGGGGPQDGGGGAGDGGSGGQDGGGATNDGGSGGGTGDGGGTSNDGGGGSGAGTDGGALDGAFVEGGGCSCETAGGGASFGGAVLALGALASLVARRRRS